MRKFLPLVFVIIAVFVFGGCGGGGGDNPAQNVAFSAMSGQWKVVSGSGTATGPDGTYNVSLVTTANNNEAEMKLNSVDQDDKSANFNVWAYSEWKATKGAITTDITLDHRPAADITVERLGANVFKYNMVGATLTVTVISDNEGEFTEEGTRTVSGYNYRYIATYKVVRK